MEIDSLNNAGNAAVAELDALTSDSTASLAEMEMPSPEQLGISIFSGPDGGMPAVIVGDTFDFPITVSWNVQGSALLVVPTGSANAKGLMQVGLSQQSSRSVKDGAEIASITFTYKIVAEDTGSLSVPALRFEIPTQVGRPLDLRSTPVPVRVNEPFNPLPVMVGIAVAVCVLLAGLWRIRRSSRARAAVVARNTAEELLRGQMMTLKQRINSADSREWLLELEGVCKEYAARRFGLAPAEVNLDVMAKEGRLEGWEVLVGEFAHARYGGGVRADFENRETWKTAMELMNVKMD